MIDNTIEDVRGAVIGELETREYYRSYKQRSLDYKNKRSKGSLWA